MQIICSIFIAIYSDGINFITKADVEGKLLGENSKKYLVDFSKGVTKFSLANHPGNYSKVLVDKSECIKE